MSRDPISVSIQVLRSCRLSRRGRRVPTGRHAVSAAVVADFRQEPGRVRGHSRTAISAAALEMTTSGGSATAPLATVGGIMVVVDLILISSTFPTLYHVSVSTLKCSAAKTTLYLSG